MGQTEQKDTWQAVNVWTDCNENSLYGSRLRAQKPQMQLQTQTNLSTYLIFIGTIPSNAAHWQLAELSISNGQLG